MHFLNDVFTAVVVVVILKIPKGKPVRAVKLGRRN